MPAWTAERLARLCLVWAGLGSRSLRKIAELGGSFEAAWSGGRKILEQAGLQPQLIERLVEWRRDADPSALVARLEKEGIEAVFPEDNGFPIAFRTMSDPPALIFKRGVWQERPCISVVGTRKATAYGQRCVESLVRELAAAGVGIVSGLALGIDAYAHETSLKAGGWTAAILGSGCDDATVYPRANAELARRILDQGGAVISEFPPGSPGRREHFPLRNRLIAAASTATLVIEAGMDSGSLITATCALEENKEVLAVPGPIWSEASAGTNHLLRLGARVCTSAKDAFDALKFDRPSLAAAARESMPTTPDEERLLVILKEPLHVDAVSEQSGFDVAKTTTMLSLLEMKGLAKRIGGQMWVKV